jgi:hypothetical protein
MIGRNEIVARKAFKDGGRDRHREIAIGFA